MALSMDEQRALAEIERRLAAEDPGLASCMTNFKRPGPAAVLRSPRARILGSVFTVLLVGMISLMVYAMIPLRGHSAKTPGQRSATTATAPGQLSMSPAGSTHGPTAASSGAATTPSTQVTANAAKHTGTAASAGTRTHAHTSTAPSAAPQSHAASGAPATSSTHHTRTHGSYP
jgi:hypothetical protein